MVGRVVPPDPAPGQSRSLVGALPVDSLGFGKHLPAEAIHHQNPVFPVKGNPVLPRLRAAAHAQGVFPDHAEMGKAPSHLLGVGSFHGVVRIGEFSSGGKGRNRGLDVHSPVGDVDHVGPPVGHQAPRVVPVPAEGEMEPVGVEGPLPGRAQPQVVVHPVRRGAVRRHWRGRLPIQIGPGPGQTNSPKLAGFHVLDGLRELGGAPLLGPHLDHPLIEASGSDHDSTLLNSQREWFLDVNVLSGLTGHDRLEGMPVIGRGHDNGIQLLQVQDLPEVPGLQGRGAGGGLNGTQRFPGLFVVHVA